MYQKKLPIDSAELDGGLSEFDGFSQAFQIFAVWSDNKKSPQSNYIDFFPTVTNLKREIEKHSEKAVLVCDRDSLFCEKKLKIILAVEGADLLCGNLSRLDALYSAGMRVLTLTWKDENCVGGAYNTEKGLTPFGKEVLQKCAQLGIVTDISHASRNTAEEVLGTPGISVIASHSNAYSLCPHTRNLTDDEFFAIRDKGGIVGINLYPPHLICGSEIGDHTPDELLDAACEHILYFLELGGEKTISLGGDRDGIPRIDGYTPARYANKLYEALIKNNIEEKIIKDIFGGNAKRFFETHLPQKERI